MPFLNEPDIPGRFVIQAGIMEKTDVIVCGAGGKMGQLVIELAKEEESLNLRAGVEQKSHLCTGKNLSGLQLKGDLKDLVKHGDIVIDFTSPDATMGFIEICAAAGAAIVIGTTGFTSSQKDNIEKMAEKMPLFFAPNMSFGVNLFFQAVRFAATLLKDYDTEITEIHHRFKKDAPSGTAIELANIVSSAPGRKQPASPRFGREGVTGPRTDEEIGIHALRMGDVVGEHSVFFGGRGQVIELSHRCYNRASFAEGAVKAAVFMRNKGNGFYGMQDMIKEVLNV